MEYQWTAPKYKEGQLVTFNGHERKGHKPVLSGRIQYVQTNYNHKGVAYHIYAIRPEKRKLDLHVGEENIFWTL